MITADNIRPAARAALLLLAAAPRTSVLRDGKLEERRVMSTRAIAGRLGIKPRELAPVMHALATEWREVAPGDYRQRGYVERAYRNEPYAAITWALRADPEVEALIAALGATVGPGRIVFDLVEIRADIADVMLTPTYERAHA